MPSCSNQRESSHGHLNSLVQWKNELFSSIKRLIDEIVKKNFKHNYSRYKNKIIRIVKNTPSHVMQSMIAYYSTNPNTGECQCWEARLISAMLGIKLPCLHLYYLKKEFPEIQTPPLTLANSTDGELCFEYDTIETTKIVLNLDYYEKIRRHAYKMIIKYSRHPNKKAINDFVNENLSF